MAKAARRTPDLRARTAAAAAALEAGADRALADLVALARIPSVSAAGFDPAQVARCADAVAALLEDVGLSGVEVLRLPGATQRCTASGGPRVPAPRRC